MKNWICSAVALLCLAMLAGCAQTPSETDPQPMNPTQQVTEPAAPTEKPTVLPTVPTTVPTVPPTIPTVPTEPTLPPPEANPFSASDFAYEGNFLTCTAAESRVGIDVSIHQGLIDWNQVAAAGVDFAMIRCGYRGYKYGQVNPDANAIMNLELARNAGLKVGVYFYSQAVSVAEAVEEAQFVLSSLEGQHLDLPVCYDWERFSDEARTANVDGRMVTDCAIAFCDAIRAGGREPMVYFNPTQAFGLLAMEELTQYKFWLAMYDTQSWFPYRVDLWQYSNTGRVPGINTNVDLNIGFFSWEEV